MSEISDKISKIKISKYRLIHINKTDISADELLQIKKEMKVEFHNYILKKMVGFNVLIESNDKIYLPISYVENRYKLDGVIKKMKLIGNVKPCKFLGQLREKQMDVVNKIRDEMMLRGGCCAEH